jgi:hypothetical protein
MKATQAGRIIGLALSTTSSNGRALVFINPGFFDPNTTSYISNGTPTGSQGSSQDPTFNSVTASVGTFQTLNIGSVKLAVDANGNLKVNGNLVATGNASFANLTVNGNLALNGSLSAPNGLAIKLGSGKSFTVNDGAKDQLSVDQNGVTVDNLHITNDATNQVNNSTGSATLKTGDKKITVNTSKIKPGSHVIVTFAGDYAPATRYWVDGIQDGKSFDLNLDQPLVASVTVTWLIIN